MKVGTPVAFDLGYYFALYCSAVANAEALGYSINGDTGIAIALIPIALTNIETRISIAIYNPRQPKISTRSLSIIRHNEVEDFVRSVKSFLVGMYIVEPDIRLMPELANETQRFPAKGEDKLPKRDTPS